MTQNAINNTIGSSSDNTSLQQIRSSSGQWVAYNDQTDSFGLYNNAGSPESSVTANTGSLCMDSSNGILYSKVGDASNTGWQSTRSDLYFVGTDTIGAVTAGEIIIDVTQSSGIHMFIMNALGTTTSGESILMQISDDNGATFESANYLSGMHGWAYNSTTVVNYNAVNTILIGPNVNNAGVGNYCSGIFYINKNANPLSVWGQCNNRSTALTTLSSWTYCAEGSTNASQPITTLRIYATSGTLINGNIEHYEYRGT